jgi:LuxR family maltose regulon positive regulatory protein
LWLSNAAIISGRQHRAVDWLDVCEACITPDTVLAGWQHAGAALLSMRASIAVPFSDSALAIDRARRALDLESAAGNPANRFARSNLAVALFRDGDFAEAVDMLEESWREHRRHEWSRTVALQVAGCLGLSLLELGRDQEVESVLHEAAPLAEDVERAWGTAAAMASTLQVAEDRLRYLQGDSAAARVSLVRAVALAELLTRPPALVLGLVYLADAEVGCGDRRAARAALFRAREIVDERGAPPFIVERLESAELRLGRGSARAAHRTGVLAKN